MDKPSPLFVTGIARSGSTLLARMLCAHPDVVVASDPYLPFFSSLRNAILKRYFGGEFTESFNETMSLQDYYYSQDRLQMMDAIQAADLEIPFDETEWPRLFESIYARAEHESPNILSLLPRLLGSTYRQMMDHSLEIVAQAWNAEDRRWVGFKEVWNIEFFILLARAYPDSRFLILHRDPRAIVSSLLAMAKRDPSQAAHVLSYLRHWRKYVAFSIHFSQDPLFAGRLFVVSYEDIVSHPRLTAQQICQFLDIPEDPGMLDPKNYIDVVTGNRWQGNSSYENELTTISAKQKERWRTELLPEARRMIDFICEPDMRVCGYEPVPEAGEPWPHPRLFEYMIQDGQGQGSWRSDFGDPQQDIGFELFRRVLLDMPFSMLDEDLIRRSFLFKDVFTRIRDAIDKGSE